MAIMTNVNGKDSRWLEVEVCRDFQWSKCSRLDSECKFAHPSSNVEIRDGHATACYDFIKGRCNRRNPACRFYHPVKHLRDRLFLNGRKFLSLRNRIQPAVESTSTEIYAVPGQVPFATQRPYLIGWNPLGNSYCVPGSMNVGLVSSQLMLAQPILTQQNVLPYQKLNAHHQKICNADLLSRRQHYLQNTLNNMLYNVAGMQDNKIELVINQARMSSYQDHLSCTTSYPAK